MKHTPPDTESKEDGQMTRFQFYAIYYLLGAILCNLIAAHTTNWRIEVLAMLAEGVLIAISSLAFICQMLNYKDK